MSILIPVYNGEKYIGETMQSVAKQTHKNIEVILVDDASTDASCEIIEKFIEGDPRFKLIRKPHSGDAVSAWPYFQKCFKGDFVIYASQDDLVSEDWIEKCLAKMIGENLDACVPDVYMFDDKDGHVISRIIGVRGDRDIVLSGREAFEYCLSWTVAGNALWKGEIIRDYEYPTFSYNADEFAVRELFLKKCERVSFCDGVFYYRQRRGSITSGKRAYKFGALLTNNRLIGLLKEYDFAPETIKFWNDEYIRYYMSWVVIMCEHKEYYEDAGIRAIVRQSYDVLHGYPYTIKTSHKWTTLRKWCFDKSYGLFLTSCRLFALKNKITKKDDGQ